MDELFPQGTAVDSQPSNFPSAATAPLDLPTSPARSNRLLFIIIASVVLLLAGGWVVVESYKYANKHFVAWMQSRRERSTGGLPAAKKDFYGTLEGLKIVEVTPNSPASRAGLKYGDVLIAYNKRPITNDEEIGAVMAYFKEQQERSGKPTTAELSLYRGGDMTVKSLQVPVGRLGIYTREWTFAGAFVEDAIVDRNDYAKAEKYLNEAAASGQYTDDQVLHMRMLCVNNEKDGDNIRQIQVDELYQKYPPDKLTLFGNYDLLYNKRFRAGAAVFERYLKITKADVSTELNLASCYTEMDKYDEADALLKRVLARPGSDENAPGEYGLSVLSNIRGRIYMGRHQYDKAQERFQAALERYPHDPYYTLSYLYCAAQLDVKGERPGEFDAAYKSVSALSHETERAMGYHIDALRAFTLVKQNRVGDARTAVMRWQNSADAKRYIPIFWSRFPEGSAIIDNWNALASQ